MDFAGVRLKKVVVAPKEVRGGVGEEEVAAYARRVREMDLDAWYDRLAPWTFRTTLVPLSLEEGRALVQACKGNKLVPLLKDVEKKIDAAMGGKSAFVKLSSRSPKDSALAGERTRKLFRAALEEKKKEKQKEAEEEELDDNDRLAAANWAHIAALRCESGEEALQLLSASERILDDLELALEGGAASWTQHIAIREWHEEEDSEEKGKKIIVGGEQWREVRGFVWKGQLTALSQYYAPAWYKELQDEKTRNFILERVDRVMEEAKGLLPLSNANECAVVDFLVSKNRTFIIECNPFNDYDSCGTSSCLFDWRKDERTLRGTRATLEFRWQTTKAPNIRALLGNAWRDMFEQEKI